MRFDDQQIVEGPVWGMNSEQRLRFLRLTEDTFGLEMRSETEAESSQADAPRPAMEVVEQFAETLAETVETQPTLVTDLETPPLPEPRLRPGCKVRTHTLMVLSSRVISVVPASPPPKPSGTVPAQSTPVRPTMPCKHPPVFASVASGGGGQMPPSRSWASSQQVPIKAAPTTTVRPVLGKPKQTPSSGPTTVFAVAQSQVNLASGEGLATSGTTSSPTPTTTSSGPAPTPTASASTTVGAFRRQHQQQPRPPVRSLSAGHSSSQPPADHPWSAGGPGVGPPESMQFPPHSLPRLEREKAGSSNVHKLGQAYDLYAGRFERSLGIRRV